MRSVLLVDDDPVTQTAVSYSLPDGFTLLTASSIKAAEEIYSTNANIALVILDRMLPDGDGLNFCTRIRAQSPTNPIPIFFLSSKSSEMDKVSSLFAGGDDYITKPFSPLELKARIMSRLRLKTHLLRIGNLSLDLSSQKALLESEDKPETIELTRIEFKILSLLAGQGDRVVSRNEILEAVWGQNLSVTDRVIDTHISHLRKKLVRCQIEIEGLRSEGYRIKTGSS